MKKIVRVRDICGHLHVEFISEKGSTEMSLVGDVRAAVAWPRGLYPGYFLFLGQEKMTNEYGKRPLILLFERAEEGQNTLFSRLAEACSRLMCFTVYVPGIGFGRRMEGFSKAFHKFIRDSHLNLRMQPAPSDENVDFGLSLVREYINSKAIVFPDDSIIRNQLKNMTSEQGPEDKDYAFHCLRYILAGYKMQRSVYRPDLAQNPMPHPKKNPRGWT